MSKAARKIINFCLFNSVGVLVCGCNADFQKNSKMGKVNNQKFVNIPFGKLRSKLQYLCEFYGIDYLEILFKIYGTVLLCLVLKQRFYAVTFGKLGDVA